MTPEELKTKIAEAQEQEWFKDTYAQFDFCNITPSQSFKGLTTIYEFVNQQVDGWNKYDNLPNELDLSKTYFINIKTSIINFVNNNYQQNRNNLDFNWQNHVLHYVRFNNQSNKLFPYDIPQVEFLLKIYRDTPDYFLGAYNSFLDITNRKNLYGAILAYEFTLKDKTEITNRIKTEQKSISKLKNDFQKYLSESEQQLITHLNNSNINYTEYVKKIDILKAEKETLFTNWYESATKNVTELEKTYREKLKLEAPAEFWENRAIKLKRQGQLMLGILIFVTIVTCTLLSLIIFNMPEMITTSLFSEDKSVALKWTFIYVTLMSFLAYFIRVLSKVMFSSFHLARDCEERNTLTYFYLSLLKDSNVADSDRQLIMQSLFSRADTGLLKEDSSPTMPSDMISKLNNK